MSRRPRCAPTESVHPEQLAGRTIHIWCQSTRSLLIFGRGPDPEWAIECVKINLVAHSETQSIVLPPTFEPDAIAISAYVTKLI